MDPATATTEVVFEEGEESALVEAIVGAQDLSVWATLMPAVYQLVPGSMIAKLWFSIIYPPELMVEEGSYVLQNNVFSDLMVTTRVELNLVIFTPSTRRQLDIFTPSTRRQLDNFHAIDATSARPHR